MPGSGFPADIRLRISDARYTDGRVVTTTMNGDLAIKGSAGVDADAVRHGRTSAGPSSPCPERLPGSLAALDVKHKNAPAAVQGAGSRRCAPAEREPAAAPAR